MRIASAHCLLAALLGLGCAAENRQAAESPAAAAQSAETPPPSPPPSAPSKIGQLPLFRALPPDGQCRIQRFEGVTAAIAAEVVYEGDNPLRIIKVAVGMPTRGFRPTNIDATVRRETGVGRDESETIFVMFDAAGNVQSGNRQSFTSDSPTRERRELLLGDPDGDAAKQLALQVLERCKVE